jgi:endonuclease YncB( thermonuclease family)
LAIALVLAAGAAFLFKPQGRLMEGAVHVVDGDSLKLRGADIRIKGIDAPELRQTCRRAGRAYPCGEAARDELRRLVAGQPVRCRVTGRDRYGRSLASCSVGGSDIGADLVRRGIAVGYGEYGREEAEARARSAGLWAGEFQRPEAWRRSHPR